MILNQNLVAGGSYTFGPTLVADLRFGYSRYPVETSPLDIGQQLATQLGIPGLNLPNRPDTWGLPRFLVGGTSGGGVSARLEPDTTATALSTSVSSFTMASPTSLGSTRTTPLSLGEPTNTPAISACPAITTVSVFNFDPSVTSLGPLGTGGLGLATFLLGLPNQFKRFGQISTNQEDRQERMFYFVQDNLCG